MRIGKADERGRDPTFLLTGNLLAAEQLHFVEERRLTAGETKLPHRFGIEELGRRGSRYEVEWTDIDGGVTARRDRWTDDLEQTFRMKDHRLAARDRSI